jgi:hypothetical protein
VDLLAGKESSPLLEVDVPLLATMRQQAATERRTSDLLAQKGVLAARFATDAIYDPLLDMYRTKSAEWSTAERAGVLSYLARVNERETMPVIERELATIGPGQTPTLFEYLTLGCAGIRALLGSRLESDDPPVVAGAATAMLITHLAALRPISILLLLLRMPALSDS